MKATFVAPDLAVLAQMLASSTSKEDFIDGVRGLIESEDCDDKIAKIVKNPANLRYTWVRFDKKEENIDFLTSLLLLSANNSFSVSNRDVIFTENSAFVNVNLLESFKAVAQEEGEEQINIDMVDKIDKEKILALSENMFDSPQFMELYSDDDGKPEMFMLTGTLSSDTWVVLQTVGLVSYRSVGRSDGDGKEKVPGMCLMFGLGMTSLMHIVSNSDKMPKHIKEDLDSFPRAKKPEEAEQEENN